MIDRSDWGPKTDGPRETPGHVPPATDPKLAEDQELVTPEDNDVGDEDLGRYRQLLKDGIFATPDELGKAFPLTPEEIAMLSKPPLSRVSIEQEIAAIEKRMRDDRRGYFKDEAAQARHLELIELREKLKASPAPTDDEPGDQADVSGLGIDPELLEEWSEGAGVEYHLGVVRRTAQGALDALEEEDAGALEESFDALPAGARTEITRFLAVEGGGAWPAANDAALQEFASTPEGSELVQTWGRESARNLGIVRGRMDLILKSMTANDRNAATAWFEGLSGSQVRGVLKTLAGR